MKFPLLDRINKAKELELMSGAYFKDYWLANYVWDLFTYGCVMVPTLVLHFIVDIRGIFGGCAEMRILFTLYFLYGLSAILYTYLWSFLHNNYRYIYYIYVLVNFSISKYSN